MATRRTNKYKVEIRPPDLAPGEVRCPACRNKMRPTRTGRLRVHKNLFGQPCLQRGHPEGVEVASFELPEVNIPTYKPRKQWL